MLSVLRRHLLLATLGSVCGAIALFAFIIATVNMLQDLLSFVLDGRIPAVLFFKLTGLLLPYVVTFALPMGMLLGILLVLGRLSADNEILAMRAAGMSIVRICRPVLILAFLGLILELFVNFYFMPRARVVYHAELDETIRATALDFVKPKTFIRDLFPNKIVYLRDRQGDVLKDLWVWDLDSQGRTLRIVHAAEARPIFHAEEATLELELKQASVENRSEKSPEGTSSAPVILRLGHFPYTTSLEHALGKAHVRRKIDWMTWSELQSEKKRLEETNAPAPSLLKVNMTIHQKLTSAVAVFAFTLVGIPLGIRVQRKETSANFALAVVLVLAYYVLSIAIGWLDRFPQLRPELMLWLPNLLFLSLGAWLLKRVDAV